MRSDYSEGMALPLFSPVEELREFIIKNILSLV
jgi:hypothetical protein